MSKRNVSIVRKISDLDAVIAGANGRLDTAWTEFDVKVQEAGLRRGRRKNMERSTAEKARTRKLCRKAGLLEKAGLIDEDDELLLGAFLAMKEGLKDPAREKAWRLRAKVKLLKPAKDASAALVIRFADQPPACVLEKLDEDGFSYDRKSRSWLGDGDLAYGQELVQLAGVGGKAMASRSPELSARP